MNIKICGIQSVPNANAAIAAGADFIGLNFVRSSKRRVNFDQAREIICSIHQTESKIKVVGVFQDQSHEYVNMIADNLGLDFIQLHGTESPEYCHLIDGEVIKAFSLKPDFDVERTYHHMKKYDVTHYLIDRMARGRGRTLSPDRVKKLAKKIPFFLAGGLTPENIVDIVSVVEPYGVDVAGGVETDGVIDGEKVKKLVISCQCSLTLRAVGNPPARPSVPFI